MKTARYAAAAGLLVFLVADAAWAANWKGHGTLTFEAASSAGLDRDVAKVMALGSIGPDFFEFKNPAAHAQTPDPEIGDDHHLAVTREQYEELQKDAFERSEAWHNFYLKAGVKAMQEGHREQAAFLLGYAMHNAEDFATHQGVTNLAHAAWDATLKGKAAAEGPDEDKERLRAARKNAKDDVEFFRSQVGEKNWQLFQGKSVRGKGLSAEVPEPLSRFGGRDLEKWDPRSGVMPPRLTSEDPTMARRLIHEEATAALAKVLGQPPDEVHLNFLNSAENFVLGLGERQDDMLDILRSVPRSPGDPPLPGPTEAFDLKHPFSAADSPLCRYILDLAQFEGGWLARRFGSTLPDQYAQLSAEEKKMLGETIWGRLMEEKIEALRGQREAARGVVAQTREVEFQDLSERRQFLEKCAQQAAKTQARLKQELRDWEREQARLNAIVRAGPPQYDAVQRAKERQDILIGVASMPLIPVIIAGDIFQGLSEGGSSQESTPSSSREYTARSSSSSSSGSNINFNSPTYNQLKSGNIGW
jgi:hypothetical protein